MSIDINQVKKVWGIIERFGSDHTELYTADIRCVAISDDPKMVLEGDKWIHAMDCQCGNRWYRVAGDFDHLHVQAQDEHEAARLISEKMIRRSEVKQHNETGFSLIDPTGEWAPEAITVEEHRLVIDGCRNPACGPDMRRLVASWN